MEVALFMVGSLLVALMANVISAYRKPKKPITHIRPSSYNKYMTKEEFIRSMEAERQQWLRELRSVYESIYTLPDIKDIPKRQPDEKVLTVKSSRILDRSGREYLTIAEVLAVLI
jgi:hypothetical protein